MTTRRILRDITPPILWRAGTRLKGVKATAAAQRAGFKYGTEQPPEFYDATYKERGHWNEHYTDSHYYALWTVMADRIRRASVTRVLDIGCGPGQVACLLRDIGVPEYTGLDFSVARVSRARSICPEYEFIDANVFESDLLETYRYDCVLMMEFLEHIDRDLELLHRVRAGTTILATVPNFRAAGHVRHFGSTADVEDRYGSLCSQLDVSAVLANKHGKTYYILHGTR